MNAPHQQRRSRAPVIAVVAVVVLAAMMVLGGRLERSQVVATYRPMLPPVAFADVCNPFPEGVELDLAYQVRADRPLTDPSGREVRRLDLHYDLVDEAVAEKSLVEALEAGGFTETPPSSGEDPDIERWFERASYGRVGIAVTPFDGLAEDTVVRGSMAIDLPTSSLTAAAREQCDNPVQTKRFPEYVDHAPQDVPDELRDDNEGRS